MTLGSLNTFGIGVVGPDDGGRVSSGHAQPDWTQRAWRGADKIGFKAELCRTGNPMCHDAQAMRAPGSRAQYPVLDVRAPGSRAQYPVLDGAGRPVCVEPRNIRDC